MNERFLCIAHEFPFPIDSGSVSRYLPMLTFLAERGPVRLVVNLRTSTTPADVARLEQQTGATVAAGGRLYEPIERKAALWAKALIERKPPWFAMWEDADLLLRVEANLDWATHVVALDDFAAQYLLRLKPRGRWLVIDKHKVYAAPTAVGEPRTDPIGRLRDRLTRALATHNETRTLGVADAVIVTSEDENDRLFAAHGVRATAVIPSAIDPPVKYWNGGDVDGPVLWLGTPLSQPNRQGLLALFGELRECSEAPFPLVVVGPDPDRGLQASADGLAVEFLGFVPDLVPLFRAASAGIIPLWSGGGGRIKTYTLMGAGLPIAASSAALEGVGAVHERHVLIAEDPRDLITAAKRLRADRDLGRRLGEAAHDLVAAHHTWPARKPLLYDLLDHLGGF